MISPQVHATREALLERFIANSVREISSHISAREIEGDGSAEGGGALNATERAETIELCAGLIHAPRDLMPCVTARAWRHMHVYTRM